MKTTDARQLNQQIQYELRKQVDRLKGKGELDNQSIHHNVEEGRNALGKGVDRVRKDKFVRDNQT